MATAYNRVRYLYALGTSDTASFDVTVAGDAPGGLITDYASLLAYAEYLMDKYTIGGAPDPYSALKSSLSSGDAFTGVNAQYVQGTAVIASAYGMLGSPSAGTGTERHPFQIARVVSLRTDEAGRTARGRCYMISTGTPVQSDGSVSPVTTQTFADGFGNLLTDVCAGHSDPTAAIQVYSRTLDVLRPVTRVLVDGTLDTQRRRRDKLRTPYQTSATYPV